MDEMQWGWILFAALAGWILGINSGIRYQKKMHKRDQLADLKTVAQHIVEHAVKAGHAGVVRIYDDDEVVHEEGDIPVDGPPKH